MPRVLIRSAATAAVVVTALLLSGLPADACPTCGSGDLSNAGLMARAPQPDGELNAGYGGNPSPNCTEEDTTFRLGEDGVDDGNDTVEHHGYLRWIPDFADDPTPPRDGPSVEWYQQVCYVPGPPSMELRGASWRRFDAVSPEALAMVAIDSMLANIPDHSISMSPQAASMVMVDTWFWITGAATEPTDPRRCQCPGGGRRRHGRPGGVTFDLGDGADPGMRRFRHALHGGCVLRLHAPVRRSRQLHGDRHDRLDRQLHRQRRGSDPDRDGGPTHRRRSPWSSTRRRPSTRGTGKDHL